jgi:haloalkane dehalogenase
MSESTTNASSAGISRAAAADLFRRPPDRYLDVGTGPDVLFVHGWPVSSATFRTLLPHLAEHVTCHLVDLPGAGSSRFTPETPLTIENHIHSVRRAVDVLELRDIAVVGHDSGGLIARHAMAGDPRLRALGLIDTEQSSGLSWRFRSFVAGRHVPGFGSALGWLAGRPRLRRTRLVFGDAFFDRTMIEGEFDEFFLQLLHRSSAHRTAAIRLLRSFDHQHVRDLGALHQRIDVPVHLVWGEHDRFFPMVADFRDADLTVVENAGLFSHEEQPAAVAAALLPLLAAPRRTGSGGDDGVGA